MSSQSDRLVAQVIASSNSTAPLISPLDESVICQLPISNQHDVDQAFVSARLAFDSWSKTSMMQRTRIIDNFHDLVLKHQSDILDIAQLENGKSRGNAMDEILDIAMTCRYYSKRAPRLMKAQNRRGAFPIFTKVKELRIPIGVIGVISPWNYPLTLAVSDFIPAILAGNTVVIKPDLQTPLSALILIDLLKQAGLPEGVVNVVLGEGADIGPLIVDRADFVMFTGSTRVGREVATRAGQRLIAASMELGGKNSLIVDRDVDVRIAAEIAARGAFANAGQLCIGTERIVVHADVYDRFLNEFADVVGALKLGSQIGWGFDVGTLINQRQIETAQRHIDDAIIRGARVVIGGTRRLDVGPLSFAPTVLVDVPLDADVCTQETFAPVCAVYKWHEEDALVAFVNNTEYGLNAAIVSRNISWAQSLAPKLRVGTVNINEAFGSAYVSIDAPMGGMGQSGVGRRHGSSGLLKFTEAQTVAQQRGMKLGPQWGMDDKGWAKFAVRAMKILKALNFK